MMDRIIGAVISFAFCAGLALLMWPVVRYFALMVPVHPAAVLPTIISGLVWGTFVYAALMFPIMVWIGVENT